MQQITSGPIIPVITFIFQADEMYINQWIYGFCEGDRLSVTPRLPVMILLLCA